MALMAAGRAMGKTKDRIQLPPWRSIFLIAAILLMTATGIPQKVGNPWMYEVTLNKYPEARWKAITSYIDKPALGDVTGDGIPEIIAASVWGDVFCIDGITGRILWAYEDDHSFELAIYICPALVDVNCDDTLDVISVTPRGYVICLDGRNGRKLWDYKAPAPIIYSPSVFDLDRNGTPEIAVSDTSGNLLLIGYTGELLWQTHVNVPFYGTPAMGIIGSRPSVSVGDKAGILRLYSGLDGKLVWQTTLSSYPLCTSPIAFKDDRDAGVPFKILVGSSDGNVHLLNAQNGTTLWKQALGSKGELSDFAIGDITGNGSLAFVFSTSGSRLVAARILNGKVLWERKYKAPLKEFLAIGGRKKLSRDVLTGEPVLADLDGNGKLDVVVAMRGLNNFVVGLHGANGNVLWAYGNKDLVNNPALNESSSVGSPDVPSSSYSTTVPSFSQPTPVVADFNGDGKADLIVNDRDEVGLICVPLPARVAPGTWGKYVSGACNNNVNFSLPCLGTWPQPVLSLKVEPAEIFAGESARLSWKSSQPGEMQIEPGIGAVAAEAFLELKPTESTTWTALVRTCGGEARTQITLLVKPPPPPPVIPVVAKEPWFLEDVFFEYDWYRLTPEAVKTLDENIEKLRAHPEARVALEATCDERGSTIYNKFLAIARAEAVQKYMIQKGILESRMEVRPMGETVKWDERLTDQGWAQNRRVHFVLLP